MSHIKIILSKICLIRVKLQQVNVGVPISTIFSEKPYIDIYRFQGSQKTYRSLRNKCGRPTLWPDRQIIIRFMLYRNVAACKILFFNCTKPPFKPFTKAIGYRNDNNNSHRARKAYKLINDNISDGVFKYT